MSVLARLDAVQKRRLKEEQMAAIIREPDRKQVYAVAKLHGVSEQTIYAWRRRVAGFEARCVSQNVA
jgi:putative transposase